MKDKNVLFLNSFFLRIIGLIFLTFGCIGKALSLDTTSSSIQTVSNIFSILGKIAVPIFCFLVIQALIYSKNRNRYILKLGILEIACLTLGSIGQYAFHIFNTSNFITDILLSVVFIMLLESKKERNYFFAFIPIIYVGLSFFATGYETLNSTTGMSIKWFPSFLRCQYPLFSFLVIVLGYFSIYILKLFSFNSLEIKTLKNDEVLQIREYRFGYNSIFILIYILILGIFFLISFLTNSSFNIFDPSIEFYGAIGSILLFFYNGKRGYNKLWFRCFSYTYFPFLISVTFGIVIAIIL